MRARSLGDVAVLREHNLRPGLSVHQLDRHLDKAALIDLKGFSLCPRMACPANHPSRRWEVPALGYSEHKKVQARRRQVQALSTDGVPDWAKRAIGATRRAWCRTGE
jgi:hypothetical protein